MPRMSENLNAFEIAMRQFDEAAGILELTESQIAILKKEIEDCIVFKSDQCLIHQ